MDEQYIHRPTPRRPGTFSITPISTVSSPPSEADPATPTSHTLERASSNLRASADTEKPPHKSRSILNLTASTLFGIYSPTADDAAQGSQKGDISSLNTPWGTGAQTPRDGYRDSPVPAEKLRERTDELPCFYTHARIQSRDAPAATVAQAEQPQSQQQRRRRATHSRSLSNPTNIAARRSILRSTFRNTLLFIFGIFYGGIVTQLHGSRVLPTTVEVRNIDRTSWTYLVFWGACGIALGNLLPWVDRSFAQSSSSIPGQSLQNKLEKKSNGNGSGVSKPTISLDWQPIIRSIGAFIGICFAIRRLPWQSTLQLSLTLALANPMIWYLLDRTRSGFLFSMAFALSGASFLISVNPDMLPMAVMSPYSSPLSYVRGSGRNETVGKKPLANTNGESYESLAVATWTASVLFCSCVCFGNIGRRLFVEEGSSGEVGGDLVSARDEKGLNGLGK